MDFSRLKAINDEKARQELDSKRYQDDQIAQIELKEVIVKSFKALADYLDGSVTKTQVLNQIKSVETPDVAKVVTALDSLHETLKTHENTDLTEVVTGLRGLQDELQKLPKELPEVKIPDPIDNSKQLELLAKAIGEVEKAIKAQKTTVEAPQVNVEAPIVQVDAPDLKPLSRDLEKAFKQAVGLISIPEPAKLDPLVKEQQKTNKTLEKILEKPTGGGAGGGGRATPYQSADGTPYFVEVDANGAIPTSSNPLSAFLIADEEETGTYSYTGFENSSGGWCIQRETLASGAYRYAAGASDYSTAWTNRATQTYQYPSQTF